MAINNRLYKLQFNKSQQINLLTQLQHLVEAGVPAPDALNHIRTVCRDKKDKVLFAVADQMCRNTSEGRKLAEGMEEWFSYEICSILIKSEERGFLSDGLKKILDYLGSNKKFFAPLGKMTTGVIYFIATLIAITIIGYVYLPKIGHYSHNWPAISTDLYNLAGFLYHDYIYVIVALIGLFVWIVWSARNYRGKFYQFVAIPFMPIYKARLSYFMLNMFSLLSANGIGVPEIINQLNKTYTKGFLSDKLKLMQFKLTSGEQNMGDVMDTGLFTQRQINELHLISRYVGEESYSKIFFVMASLISSSIIKMLTKVSVIINFVCMLLTGACILWIYGAYALLASSIN